MKRSTAILVLLLVPACAAAGPGASRANAPDIASPPAQSEQVVKVTARKFEFSPSVIRLKVHVPAVIELTSLDRTHGFAVPDFQVDEEIAPGKTTLVRLTPETTGVHAFHCGVFCGEGHETMVGEIVVEP
jgi:cytochrome c oxidase subunit II